MQKGDVIYADRGLYRHYGVYAGHNRVIHYANKDGGPGSRVTVRETSWDAFAKGCRVYVSGIPAGTKLYPPGKTIRRARSQIGKTGYSLVWWNCEHFAFWCKTGRARSKQVDNTCALFFGKDTGPEEAAEKLLMPVVDFLEGIANGLEDFAEKLS